MVEFTLPNDGDASRCCAVGAYYAEGPPVPIPNTVVKLMRAENSWRAASRKDRSTPTRLPQNFFKKVEKSS